MADSHVGVRNHQTPAPALSADMAVERSESLESSLIWTGMVGCHRPTLDRGLTGRGAGAQGGHQDRLRKTISTVSAYARLAPEHKPRIVDSFQSHQIVAMTGDGVNDAVGRQGR